MAALNRVLKGSARRSSASPVTSVVATLSKMQRTEMTSLTVSCGRQVRVVEPTEEGHTRSCAAAEWRRQKSRDVQAYFLALARLASACVIRSGTMILLVR